MTRDNDVRFRIWTEPSSLDQAAYAREIGPKILEFFEGYFNISFPLPKQDMIAIPDFGAVSKILRFNIFWVCKFLF